MGNCGTKPKTSDGDDAPPPAELPTAAGAAPEGERKDEDVAAPGEANQAVVAPRSEEATTTTAAETKEHDEPKEEEAVPKEDADQGKEKETPPAEAAGELPASAPASVA